MVGRTKEQMKCCSCSGGSYHPSHRTDRGSVKYKDLECPPARRQKVDGVLFLFSFLSASRHTESSCGEEVNLGC